MVGRTSVMMGNRVFVMVGSVLWDGSIGFRERGGSMETWRSAPPRGRWRGRDALAPLGRSDAKDELVPARSLGRAAGRVGEVPEEGVTTVRKARAGRQLSEPG
jgi:hypothetical protein